MHVDYEIVNAGWVPQFGPAGTVQHANVKLVVVLYRLHHKVTAHIITFVHLGHIVDSIVVATDGQRIVGPKLWKRLCASVREMKKKNGQKLGSEQN